MDTIIYGLGLMTILAVVTGFSYFVGWFLTSVVTIPLAYKPFNCRGCLTFWLTFIIGCIVFTVLPIRMSCPDTVKLVRVFYYCNSFITGLTIYFYIQSKFKIYD